MSHIYNQLVRLSSFEDNEVKQKEIQLCELEEELTDYQLQLTTLKLDLSFFEARYLQIVGSLYAELDALKAEVAELISALNPTDQAAHDKAKSFRSQAQETAKEANYSKGRVPKPEFRPSDDLKKLLREAAKLMHPDLANNESERIHRHEAMTKANSAYAENDEARLENIIQDWKSNQWPQEIDSETKLTKITLRIDKVQQVIYQIKSKINSLQGSDIGNLMARYNKAKLKNRDILLDMAVNLRAEIVCERGNLATLTTERNQT